MRVKVFLTFIISICLTVLQAQPVTEFPADPGQYTATLNSLLKPDDKETQDLLAVFTASWQGFPGDLQQKIVETSNQMIKQRVQAAQFRNYISSINRLTSAGYSSNSLKAWNTQLPSQINPRQPRSLIQFLQRTDDLAQNKTLFRSMANSWKFRGNRTPELTFDSTLVVNLQDIDLVSVSSRDSIEVFGTQGKHYFLLDLFEGSGGRMDWTMVKLDREKVFVSLQNYKLNLKQTGFTAEKVKFHHRDYFPHPLDGSVEFRMLQGMPPERANFPKFESDKADIFIPKLFDVFSLKGKFSLEGIRVNMIGTTGDDAILTLQRSNKPWTVMTSKGFTVREDQISAKRAAFVTYIERDSIFHPGLTVRYLNDKKELSFLRTNEGIAASPFFNSFHNVDMYFESIFHQIGSDSLHFGAIPAISPESFAIFESDNYYTADRFNQIQLVDNVNPLNVVYNYMHHHNTDRFTSGELAEFTRKPHEQTKVMLLNLANRGFLTYNLDNDEVTVHEKLNHYLNARSKKQDYDVIQIRSKVERMNNAVLNLETQQLRIRGVDQVSLSGVQAVEIYPYDKQVVLLEDREFFFNGLVKAGYFDFHARKNLFEYDNFKLNMPQIDSISFMVDVPDPDGGKPTQVRVRNVIADAGGELLIDAPDNKSSAKEYPQFPTFITNKESFVYFDKTSHSTYARDKFFYSIEPFVFDSLNSFRPSSFSFDGKLVSGGIVPDIHQPITVMDDYSLGFNSKTPAEGLPLYGGKGTYYDDISLSNRGLEGSGRMNYLNAAAESDKFKFYPDSTISTLKVFELQEKTSAPTNPYVLAENVQQVWTPNSGAMSLKNAPGSAFAMFRDQSSHDGVLQLSDQGLNGYGTTTLQNADITSGRFTFTNQAINSDTTDFKIYYPARPNLSLITKVPQANIDLGTKQGIIGKPGVSTRIDLPLSQYYAYMDRIEWNMDQSQLLLSNSLAKRADIGNADLRQLVDFDFTGSEFVSTDPVRDSLKFYAMEATYQMDQNIIEAREVMKLMVADAAIFPGDGRITILANGDMKTLSEASLITNTKSKFHKVYDASVEVKSSRYYGAQGLIDYQDAVGNVLPVLFQSISPDSTGVTHGTAKVTSSKPLMLGPEFAFVGDIKLNASEEGLYYNGNYRPVAPCFPADGPWVRFQSSLLASNLMLPVVKPMRDTLREPIVMGIVFSDYFTTIYPAAYEKPKAYADVELATAEGFMKFNRQKGIFEIGSEDRLNGHSKPGNYMTFDTTGCVYKAEGLVNLGAKFGHPELVSAGETTYYGFADSTTFDLALAFKFYFSDVAMAKLVDMISQASLTSMEVNTPSFMQLVYGRLGEEQGNKLLQAIHKDGQPGSVPEAFRSNLTFSNVRLVWDPKMKSYISEGPVGLVSVNDNFVFRKVNSIIEVGKRRTGDIFNIHMDLGNNEWIYFSFGGGFMKAVSSNNEFNAILADLKEKQTKLDTKQGEQQYQYILTPPDTRISFLRRLQSR